MINHALLLEQAKIHYNDETFWLCFSTCCLVALLMFMIQYIINIWERRKNGRIQHRKGRKSQLR